ncbi:hypothetical protein [Lysinibacillus fusiformis]|uniref:hypothetical protein n=1 Tax=Lysinibacillus fusiformis TaxID=28031 RepID=UPI00380EA935
MARMRVIGASLDKGYRDDLNYNFGLLESLIGEANGLTDNLRKEMLAEVKNLQDQINMLTGENIGELLERLNDAIQQALTAAQEARTAKTATDQATVLATVATELANASALLAEEKANYAGEKAVLAQQAADNANQEAANLSQLKIDAVKATQDANAATGNANQTTQAAKTATDAINVVLPNVTGLVNLKEWNIETQYKKNNFVTLEGNGYMALRDNKGVKPPSSPVLSTADWAMFVQKGEKGEQGTGVRILGTLPDENSLPSIGEPGDAYLINGDLYVWSDTTNDWTNVGTIKGPKGDTGPQGTTGEQGPPGQDADLTEVNQEIANIKQTATDNKTEVTEHLGQKVLSEDGAHGIRYFNDKLEIENENGTDWSEIEIGTPNDKGTVRLSDNHAIRRFHYNEWTNDDTIEYLRVFFPSKALGGKFTVRMVSDNTVGKVVTGAGEYLFGFYYDPDKDVLIQSMDVLQVAVGMGSAIRMWVLNKIPSRRQPYFTISKKKWATSIFFEIDYISTNGEDAAGILDAITLELDSSPTAPDTAPEQQSIFTHVGNSKANLATAITGKGVATTADATFAQMVANINAIPTGTKKVIGTTQASSVGVAFKYSGSTANINIPYVDITLDFEPSTIYLFYIDSTDNSHNISVFNRYQEYYPDPVKVSRYNGTQLTNNNYQVEVIKLSPTKFRMPVARVNANTFWTAYQ